MEAYPTDVEAKMRRFYGWLSEKDRRRYAAVEAAKLGHGGVEYIAQLLACDPKTIWQGTKDLGESEDPAVGRVRKKGSSAEFVGGCWVPRHSQGRSQGPQVPPPDLLLLPSSLLFRRRTVTVPGSGLQVHRVRPPVRNGLSGPSCYGDRTRCILRLSSTVSPRKSRLFTARLCGWTLASNWHLKCALNRAPTADQSVLAVIASGLAMIGSHHDVSSSCRFGRLPCSSSILCVGLPVQPAAVWSRRYPGAMGNASSPRPIVGSWLAGASGSPGRRSRVYFIRHGMSSTARFTMPSHGDWNSVT